MAGRPSTSIDFNTFINLSKERDENFNLLTFNDIADRLGVNIQVLRRWRKKNMDAIQDNITFKPIHKDDDEKVISIIRPILEENQLWGHVMLLSKINAEGYTVGRDRLKRIIKEIDPEGSEIRKRTKLKRREYVSKGFGYMWHIDTDHKLGNKSFGFVIASAIDGSTRFCPYINIATDNSAGTNLIAFKKGVEAYGLPSRVRADRGGEGVKIARYMLRRRGLNRGSYITGRSIHNQRIERFNLDCNEKVLKPYQRLWDELNNNRIFDNSNNAHKFVLQYMLLSKLKKDIESFRLCWNLHKCRTEKYKSPNELRQARHLIFREPLDDDDSDVDNMSEEGDDDIEPHVKVTSVLNPLNEIGYEYFKHYCIPIQSHETDNNIKLERCEAAIQFMDYIINNGIPEDFDPDNLSNDDDDNSNNNHDNNNQYEFSDSSDSDSDSD